MESIMASNLILSGFSQWPLLQSKLVYTALILLLTIATTYLLTTLRSSFALSSRNKARNGASPPIVPYTLPFLGNLIPFANNTQAFISHIRANFGIGIPIRIKIGNRNIFYVSGPESLLTLFRNSKDLTTTPSVTMIMENTFEVPKSIRHVYARDNTGVFGSPVEGSNHVGAKDRYWYIGHELLHAGLQGPDLDTLPARFLENLEAELKGLEIGDEWVEFEDFYQIVRRTCFKASTTALCGPHIFKLTPNIFKLTPNFADLFWEFDANVVRLFKGIPRWVIPNSYRVRDRYVKAVKKWNLFTKENAGDGCKDEEWEEFYGTKLMRDRAREFGRIDGMNEDGMASENAGMLWGANANIVPAIAWCIIDSLLRPSLLSRVQKEILPSPLNDEPHISTLITSPLLQSLFTEELRLRGSVAVQRTPVIPNFKIGNWKIPQGNLILTSSWHEQHAAETWNQSPTLRDPTPHPITEFWAERFLIYPDDASTGPQKPPPIKTSTNSKPIPETPAPKFEPEDKPQQTIPEPNLETQPKFTTTPVNGSFIPFGGGQKMCPGRFYAKYEAIGGMALFLSMFEIELDVALEDVRMDMGYFAFGVIPPKNKFPGQMKRRV